MRQLEHINKLITENLGILHGSADAIAFKNYKTVFDSDGESLIWLEKKYFERIRHAIAAPVTANCLICDFQPDFRLFNLKVFIVCPNPRLMFAQMYHLVNSSNRPAGVHPTATIHREARIAESCWIGPNCYIGKASIGEGTFIAGNAFIHDNVTIGNNCFLDAGVMIGVEGFGHMKNNEDKWVRFPQLGGTVIEDNVEIGASTYVTRGALGLTQIKKGAIVGLSCGIGHNAVLEENAYVTSKSLIGGSSVIGKNAIIGIFSVIRDGILVGENAVTGMGSVVTKSIPPHETWLGNPAKKYG